MLLTQIAKLLINEMFNFRAGNGRQSPPVGMIVWEGQFTLCSPMQIHSNLSSMDDFSYRTHLHSHHKVCFTSHYLFPNPHRLFGISHSHQHGKYIGEGKYKRQDWLLVHP